MNTLWINFLSLQVTKFFHLLVMAFLRLPDELLELIVSHSIPEGFESLCLACRKLHTLCKPLIKRHNVLRSQFRRFDYFEKVADQSFTIRTSFELIARIAAEPVVARYIQHADFKMDLRLPVGPRLWFMEGNGYRPDTVRDLFAKSRYLGGNDWQKYYAEFEQALEYNRYSQAAAAFLLTLLPNIKSVALPQLWKPDGSTERLLQAVVEKARQPSVALNNASLAGLTTLETSVSLVQRQGLVLYKITPLLALPRLRSFHGPRSVADVAIGQEASYVHSLQPSIGMAMETAHLLSCTLDGATMEYFLRCTPCLKTLVYSHTSKDVAAPWNICELVTAIVKQASSHLEELSITLHDFKGRIALGTASMRPFTRLHKLEFPLDLATCIIKDAAQHKLQDGKEDSKRHTGSAHNEFLMCGLVPASVSRLFLRSDGWGRGDEVHESSPSKEEYSSFQIMPQQHEQTLQTMFRGFTANKDEQLPALREIRLSEPATAGEAYKARCRGLLSEAETVGVKMQLDPVRWMSTMNWAGA